MGKKLVDNIGGGPPNRDSGKFEVKYEGGERSFTLYQEAEDFYESLNVPAYLWDLTGIPELCSGKDWVEE